MITVDISCCCIELPLRLTPQERIVRNQFRRDRMFQGNRDMEAYVIPTERASEITEGGK